MCELLEEGAARKRKGPVAKEAKQAVLQRVVSSHVWLPRSLCVQALYLVVVPESPTREGRLEACRQLLESKADLMTTAKVNHGLQ